MAYTSESLRQVVQGLPSISGVSFWDKRRSELRAQILSRSLHDFLRWPTVNGTMFVGNAPYIDQEWMGLPQPYMDAIREPRIGEPTLYSNYTSGNLIHQAYHLSRWAMATGQSVFDLQRIVEFGAGYGALPLIVHRLGFRGHYQIIDLPEFSLLQQWYLGQTLPDVTTITWSEQPALCDLLITIHSLSETEPELRHRILTDFPARSYLFVYHDEHEGVDNWRYFADYAKQRPDCQWQEWRTSHLPTQSYLIGEVRHESSH